MAVFIFGNCSVATSSDQVKLDTLNVGNNTYSNAVVTKLDEATAKIVHSGGIAKVSISKLPESLKSALGYDQTKAQTAESSKRLEAEKEARANADLAEATKLPSIRFKVESNSVDGVLAFEMKVEEDRRAPAAVSGLGRAGGGGYDTRKVESTYHWAATTKRAFFPTTPEIAAKGIDSEFTARVIQTGTHRTIDQDVVPAFKIFRLEENKAAKPPPKK